MAFRFTPTSIPTVIVIEPLIIPDDRGFFVETYKRSEFAANGITDTFIQCNQSRSVRGTLRGLHYQRSPKSQGKLVHVLYGEIYDVAVDLRADVSTYGKWTAVPLSSQNKKILYVPPGFAHGFCVISDEAEVSYMTSEEYAPSLEGGVLWNDPDLNIVWPITEPQLSDRDRAWPRLKDADHPRLRE